ADVAGRRDCVCIKPRDNVASRGANAEVQRRGNTTGWIIDQCYWHIGAFATKFCDHVSRAILRESVNDDDLVALRIVLVGEITKRLSDEALFIEAGDDD